MKEKLQSLTHPLVCRSGFAVGIYTTNSPEACQYVAENCKANIIVVENHKQLQKILQVRSGRAIRCMLTLWKINYMNPIKGDVWIRHAVP